MGIQFNREQIDLLPVAASLRSVHDRALHGVQRIHQSIHVAHIDPTIPVGWQRTAGQEVNIGALAADEQNSFSRLDAGVNFRRQAHSRRRDRAA